MESKVCVITGCNSGIGKVTATELAKKGYEIIMLVRDSEKSRTAFKEIKKESRGKIILKYVNLASLDAIKIVSEEIKSEYNRIDVLINNAGLYKRTFETSADSFEMTLAVNYFAPFALTNYLLPLLKRSKKTRIIYVASELYKRGKIHLDNDFSDNAFKGNKAYANSKLLLVYFTKELSILLADKKITVNCVHPGFIGTDVFREYPKWLTKFFSLLISKPSEGAEPSIYLASSHDVNTVTGKYFYKTEQKKTDAVANDAAMSERIWKKTEENGRINRHNICCVAYQAPLNFRECHK